MEAHSSVLPLGESYLNTPILPLPALFRSPMWFPCQDPILHCGPSPGRHAHKACSHIGRNAFQQLGLFYISGHTSNISIFACNIFVSLMLAFAGLDPSRSPPPAPRGRSPCCIFQGTISPKTAFVSTLANL
jgi:hypothetical protein